MQHCPSNLTVLSHLIIALLERRWTELLFTFTLLALNLIIIVLCNQFDFISYRKVLHLLNFTSGSWQSNITQSWITKTNPREKCFFFFLFQKYIYIFFPGTCDSMTLLSWLFFFPPFLQITHLFPFYVIKILGKKNAFKFYKSLID